MTKRPITNSIATPGAPEYKIFSGRPIAPGIALGEALVTSENFSFFGGVDPDLGIVVEKGHELEGKNIAGKILVFPTGKGSTVGSYTLYRLAKAGKAPAAILNAECEPIVAVGCILAGIPCVDHIPIERITSGDLLQVDGESGRVEFQRQPKNAIRPFSGGTWDRNNHPK